MLQTGPLNSKRSIEVTVMSQADICQKINVTMIRSRCASSRFNRLPTGLFVLVTIMMMTFIAVIIVIIMVSDKEVCACLRDLRFVSHQYEMHNTDRSASSSRI